MSNHLLIKLVEQYAPETVSKAIRKVEDLRQVERDARLERKTTERELLAQFADGAGAFAQVA
jgi:hypothetical protein